MQTVKSNSTFVSEFVRYFFKTKIQNQMKNVNKIFTMAIFAIGFATSASAQVSATATSTATIVAPLAIAKTVDMNFGNVAVGASLGTVVLSPAAGRTTTGGVTLSASTPGTVTAAAFNVTGEGAYTYAITLPSSAVTLTRNAGTETMTATAFTSTPSGTGALTAGAQTLNVGATLNVAASQVAGTYVSGTAFTVSVVYN